MKRLALTLLLLTVLGAVVFVASQRASPPETDDSGARGLSVVDEPRYVGRASCARCHEEPLAAWTGSYHDLALAEATPDAVVAPFDDRSFEYHGVVTTFEQRGGEFRVRSDGADGALADFSVAYTIGSYPLQQFLLPFPRGRQQALNVCWDARPEDAGGQRWFHLYPNENVAHDDVLHWTGPYQNWNFMCAECHSTDLRRNYDFATDSYATSWSEIDVSCEACHGPASAHVAWADASERGETATAVERFGLTVALKDPDRATWGFEPDSPTARRSHARRTPEPLDSCARCHARRSVIDDGYVPGASFLDHYQPALLAETLYHADGQFLDEVYEYGSFLQSKMHAAGVTCTDCHDAHSTKLKAADNDLCARCHQPETFDAPKHHFHVQGGAGSRCVDCHMTLRNFMVVDGRRDHGFRVPRPDLTVKLGTPNACNDCHADKAPQWAQQAAAGWWGTARASKPHFAEALHAGRRRSAGAERLLEAVLNDLEQPAIVRATAVSLLGDIGARDVLDSIAPAFEDREPLVRAAAADALQAVELAERGRLAAPLIVDPIRLVRIEAAHALAAAPRAALSADQRRAFDAALDEYRRSQLVNADRPESHMNLGTLAIELSDLAGAEKEFATAIRLAPRFPAAYANLADVHRMQGRDGEAEAVLRRGLEADPRSADLHHALGLTLIRRERRDEARIELARAVELAPDSIRYRYVLAVALQSTGQLDAALTELLRAYDRQPTDLSVLDALIGFSLEAGEPDDALRYGAEYLALDPSNAEIAALIARLRAGR